MKISLNMMHFGCCVYMVVGGHLACVGVKMIGVMFQYESGKCVVCSL